MRVRARRSPRVARTVDVTFAPASARARKFAITTSRPSQSPVFTTRTRSSMKVSSARISAIAAQSWALKYAKKRSSARACRVFQPRRLWLKFVKARKRGVEVCLVEDLATTDQVAFDREKVDHPPLGIEALWRGPIEHVGDNGSEVAQPMHGLDVDAGVRREVPYGTNRCRQISRPRSLAAADGRCRQVGVVAGSSCRLNAA